MSARRAVAALLAAACALALPACGYHLAGRGSNLPAHVKVIAVPQFNNQTSRPELGQRITEAIVEELVSRARFKVQAEEKGADAAFTGTVLAWNNRPVSLTQETSDAQRVSVTLRAAVQFEDRVEKRVTWRQESYTFTQEYDVVGDPDQYFDTELGAVEEVADDFARAVVSAVLQGF